MWSLQNTIWELRWTKIQSYAYSVQLPLTYSFISNYCTKQFFAPTCSATYCSHPQEATLVRRHKQRILLRYGKFTHVRFLQQIIDVQHKNIIQNKMHAQYYSIKRYNVKPVSKHLAVLDINCSDAVDTQGFDTRCLLHEWSFCTAVSAKIYNAYQCKKLRLQFPI